MTPLVNNRTSLIQEAAKQERIREIQTGVSRPSYPKEDTIDRSYDHRTSVGLSEVMHFNASRQEESFAKELDPIVHGGGRMSTMEASPQPIVTRPDIEQLLDPVEHVYQDCGCSISPSDLRKAQDELRVALEERKRAA